ncbi:MAG TPA: Holliday junction resolvase RuvX [Candidatus Eisenbacteria bacterium]
MTTRSDDRILAVDPGTKRIGLAVASVTQGMASRLAVLDVQPGASGLERAVRAVARHAAEEEATRILVGLPLHLDGREGKEARAARRLGLALAEATGLPVDFADERLTSEAAIEEARKSGWTPKSKKPIDDLAAALLLQGWLDDASARAARQRLNEST